MKRLVAVCVSLSLLFLGTPARAAGSTLSAEFSAAIGVNQGSDVRILGVKVGEVVSVVPRGDRVLVEMRYDGQLPQDVAAIIVPPSIVSDRYIQLAPAYTGGPVLPARAHITRTAVPMELDDVYRALDQLNRDLGPQGANKDGALSRLVTVGRANLEGNGQALNATLEGTSKALSTLAKGRQDLFDSVVNLQRFTSMLARNDEQVRAFNKTLSSVAQQLASDAGELELALRKLSHALAELAGFVRDNRAQLASNVEGLVDLTNVLVRQQQAVIDVLDVAPLALSNLGLSYNPLTGTTDTRNNATGPHNAAAYICSLMVNVLPAPEVPQQCFDLAKLVQP